MANMEDIGRDWPQILTIIIACIPGITSSLIFTWPSTFIPVLTEEYGFSESEANIVPIVSTVGWLITATFLFKIPDLIGRKYCLLLLNVPQAAYWIITIFAKDIYGFYIARFIGGMADAIMYMVLPIYVGEVTTPRIRGTWGNGQTFSFNAGFFIISVVGCYTTIRQTAYIFLTLPLIFTIAFLWMPESPYYCLMKGKDDQARASLQWLLRKKNIEPDFQQLKKDVYRQISETGTWADLFKIKSNRKAVIAGIFTRIAQQLAGIAVFESYFQFIFDKASSTSLSPEISAVLFSGALWLIMTGFSFTVDKFGRRQSFIYSSLGCSICLTAESIYFYIDEFQKQVDLTSIQWFPIAGLIIYVFFYCFGLGVLPSLMAGELYSASIKGKALSVANVAIGGILLTTTSIFKFLSAKFGLYVPLAVFGIGSFISFLLSFSLVPETKGKTLEEIQQDLKSSKKSTPKQ